MTRPPATDKPFPCPYCARAFADADGRWMHAKAKHPGRSLKALKTDRQREADAKVRVRGPDPGEESMASRMIDAQLQFAMGGPVDEDWLLDCL